MHLHTIDVEPFTLGVFCTGCDRQFRLATADEARFVQMTDGWSTDGPLRGPNDWVIVPVDFSIVQGV